MGLAAAGHPGPAAVQALLAAPGAFQDGGVLAAVPTRELIADGRTPARMPRGLDQQPSRVRRAGLGDRALSASLTAGALGRDQADEAHELFGRLEAGELADLADQPDRGQRVDAAHAA